MTQQPRIPDPEKVKQTAAKLRDVCYMFDAQIMVLDELIAQVEAENRNNLLNVYRRNRGQRLLEEYKQKQAASKTSV